MRLSAKCNKQSLLTYKINLFNPHKDLNFYNDGQPKKNKYLVNIYSLINEIE